MSDKIKKILFAENTKFVLEFAAKTFFYLAIMLLLLYLYHFNHTNGSTFIYNEF